MTDERGLVEPIRLKHSGYDLDDRAEVGGYALPAMRAAVHQRVAAGSVGAAPVVVAVAAGALVAGWLVWGALAAPASAPSQPVAVAAASSSPVAMAGGAPTDAPAGADAPPVEARSVQPTPVAAGAERSLSVAPTVGRAGTGSADDAAVVSLPEQVGPEAGLAVDVAESDPALAGDLSAQTTAYREGSLALAAGRFDDAARAHRAYLERWPQGVYRDDALVSILDLLIRDGAWGHVEPLARDLALVSTLSQRHAEFRRVRAEALVQLGRCDEALAVAETVSRDDAASVRRTCRGGGR